MIADMQARGVAVESDGALIVEVADPSDAKPMPPLLLAKSDGAALYATTDLATIVARKRDQNPDRILYVVDQRQALHFEQVFRAARKADLAPGVDMVHVGFGTVNGVDGKPYKTRQGGVAQLADLLNEAIDKAAERLAERDTTTDKSELARLVGLAAIKFADLSSYRLSGYIFDAARLVSFEGRTGPYVQYACVRIGSILASAAEKMYDAGDIAVATASERALVFECARLPEVVASATRNLAPNERLPITPSRSPRLSAASTRNAQCWLPTPRRNAPRASLCASSLARSSPKSFGFWASKYPSACKPAGRTTARLERQQRRETLPPTSAIVAVLGPPRQGTRRERTPPKRGHDNRCPAVNPAPCLWFCRPVRTRVR